MKYKHLLNLKTKPVIPKALSSPCRFLGGLLKHPPHLLCRLQYNAWNSLGQVLHQPFHGGLLVVRMLSVFGLLVWSILLSSCTGTTARDSSPPPSPVERPKVSMLISDLAVKRATITHGEKPVTCGKIESNVALFLVYEYKTILRFSQFSETLPVYNMQVTVIGNNGAYKVILAPERLSPEIKEYTPGLILNGDVNLSHSNELTLNSSCTAKERTAPIPGDPKHVRVETTHTMTMPQAGKFTLTLSANGQQLSKEFVAQ